MTAYRDPATTSSPPEPPSAPEAQRPPGPVLATKPTSTFGFWLIAAPMLIIGAIFGPAAFFVAILCALVWGIPFFLLSPKAWNIRMRAAERVPWRGTPVLLYFDELASVFIEGKTIGPEMLGGVTRVRLVDRSGRSMNIPTDDEDGVALFQALHLHVIDPIRTEALITLDEGEPLTFGKVSVWPEKLRVGTLEAGWDEVEVVSLTMRRLRLLTRDGRTAQAATRDIPFPTVLLAALQHLGVPLELRGGFANDEST